MKILHVIHGYPPYYMAGSEVYTYNLTQELAKKDDVYIFTRVENPFEKSYAVSDEKNERLRIRRINKPQRDYTLKDKYMDKKIDEAFTRFVKKVKPDVVHIGHLSHLSSNIVNITKDKFNLPVVFTIHDFWLFCFRGQMIDTEYGLCPSPSNEACLQCGKSLFKDSIEIEGIIRYREHMMHVIDNVDIFLSPSMFLKNFFELNGIPSTKVLHSRYGFNKNKIRYKKRDFEKESIINFGFMGRIIPVKGIKTLLEAFQDIRSQKSKLLVFGNAGVYKKYLDIYMRDNIIFKGGYKNWEINEVLDQIDVLVVPSQWYENSPLVIQEAFLAGIPVITSNIGGMAELVNDGVDGLLFEMGDSDALGKLMKKIVKDPTLLNNLKPDRDKVRSIEDDSSGVRSIYREVLNV